MKAPSLLSVSSVNILLFPCYGENWIAPGYLHNLPAPHFLGSRDCEILTPGQKVAIIKKKNTKLIKSFAFFFILLVVTFSSLLFVDHKVLY